MHIQDLGNVTVYLIHVLSPMKEYALSTLTVSAFALSEVVAAESNPRFVSSRK